ncbi:MAG: nitroreductase family protein [Okeania sp. SIO3H1]|uniref:nitroreductase family protein n=1 Tax=Okeania sp. SIO1I7 TaxID=2607772 RepID=UPI0013C95D14|nr:nitroreductase family protein [Okeania sp. SIO1I7]NEN92282.1 nitroreductase family protein [Okeania sp. SIO3H1]NET24813.1 nitroreductase family protein [Okeania sp. SIO1I7]
MEKYTENKYPINNLLKQRWSSLAFADKMVSSEVLLSLLEAARWSPSCFNEQPWSFIIATKENPAEYDRLFSCIVEGNQPWAGLAPVLMLSVAKLFFDKNNKPNRHAFHDVGLAVASLTFQATEMGLRVHQMGGFHLDKARELYKISQGYEPVAAIAIGYPEEPDILPESLRERELSPRSRKPINSFVFTGEWGQTSL